MTVINISDYQEPTSCTTSNINVVVYGSGFPEPNLQCQFSGLSHPPICELDSGLCMNWIQRATNQYSVCPQSAHFTPSDGVPDLQACQAAASSLGT